ncbi:hypothetical protein [Streptomyces bacillaris]|uniref:hypothetical protein n=1 Tax=Streptomyces bacillaris TaxID=68179 RepID=UPI003824B562
MTIRTVLRWVRHGIGTAEESEVTMTARCLMPGCDWTLAPTSNQDAGNEACMTHKGRTGHTHFARVWEDVAEVRQLELNERQKVGV